MLKINNALTLDQMKSQWIDLGIHTDVCMTRPDTCGVAGGAISLWVKLTGDCIKQHGIISSLTKQSSGSLISCLFGTLRYDLLIQIYVTGPRTHGWGWYIVYKSSGRKIGNSRRGPGVLPFHVGVHGSGWLWLAQNTYTESSLHGFEKELEILQTNILLKKAVTFQRVLSWVSKHLLRF